MTPSAHSVPLPARDDRFDVLAVATSHFDPVVVALHHLEQSETLRASWPALALDEGLPGVKRGQRTAVFNESRDAECATA
jgi:hypothetical protein